MKKLYDCISLIFPEDSVDVAYGFFSQHMSDSHKYMDVDFLANSILNRKEFYERATFMTYDFKDESPYKRDGAYYIGMDVYNSNRNVLYHEETGCVSFHGDEGKLCIIENNFSDFIHNIAIKDDDGFSEYILHSDINYKSPDFHITFSDFCEKMKDAPSFDFDFVKPGSVGAEHKEGFFYRAQLNLWFPAERIKDSNLPAGEWFCFGFGWGDEDVGSMECSILVDKISGSIAFYKPYIPIFIPILERIRNFFVKPKPRVYDEYEFFIISTDINDFVDKVKQHRAKITTYTT